MSLMSSNIFKVNNIYHGNVGTPKENSFKENRIFSVKSMAAAVEMMIAAAAPTDIIAIGRTKK